MNRHQVNIMADGVMRSTLPRVPFYTARENDLNQWEQSLSVQHLLLFTETLLTLLQMIARNGPRSSIFLIFISRIRSSVSSWFSTTRTTSKFRFDIKLTIIGSDNGLSPGRCQAIIRTNAGILSIGHLGTNFIEILIEIQTFSLTKITFEIVCEMLSISSRPQCVNDS